VKAGIPEIKKKKSFPEGEKKGMKQGEKKK